MTDYRQELVSPKWRNLALNPGAETSSLGPGFVADNGYIYVGRTVADGAPAPVSGLGVFEYEVSLASSQSYWFGPIGPLRTVHIGAFKIPNARTVSARILVQASTAVWIEVQAAWLVPTWEGSIPTGTLELSRSIVLPAIAVSNAGWVALQFLVDEVNIPADVTHWRPVIAVYSANPATNPAPPIVGTKVWADEFFVPDSGMPVAGVPYGDGSLPGWEWEGAEYYSSSRTEDTSPEAPAGEDLLPVGGSATMRSAPVQLTDPAPGEPPATSSPTESGTLPPPIDAGDPGYQAAPGGPSATSLAEDVIGWRRDARHIHLHEDVQLEGMKFNSMDDFGVVWIVNDIEGWWTTPEPDVPDVSRGWFDGSYETRGRYQARTFTLTGSFMPRNIQDVAPAHGLIRASNLVHRGGWFLTREDPPGKTVYKGSKVWLAGAPLIATTGLNGKTDFSIALRAPDPVKQSIKNGEPPGYDSITLTSANVKYPERAYRDEAGRDTFRTYPWNYPPTDVYGSVRIDAINDGNVVVWPIIRMAGPTSGGLIIYNDTTGQEFEITRKLYAGEILEIDCFTKQVTLNGFGNHRFYLAVDVDWLMLQPGPNKLWFSEITVGGIKTELQILWRSGWIG